jgi:hypothetical protein
MTAWKVSGSVRWYKSCVAEGGWPYSLNPILQALAPEVAQDASLARPIEPARLAIDNRVSFAGDEGLNAAQPSLLVTTKRG